MTQNSNDIMHKYPSEEMLVDEERLLDKFRKKEYLFKILVIGDYGVGE